MEKQKAAPGLEARLRPELMVEVCRALNFDPEEFAKRHGEEFTRQYLRLDGMLSYVGEEILVYLAPRINECLSKAEYALLSYVEYAGRTEKGEDDGFSDAVARYLEVRREAGNEWLYAFEGENAKARCVETYPQLYAIAHAMYAFAGEIRDLKAVAETDGPDAWPDPKKVCSPAKREAWTEV